MLSASPMRRVKARSQALLSFVVLAGALVSRAARADVPTVTGFTGPVVRLAKDGKTAASPHASSSVALNVVNYADCTSDYEYNFPIAVTGAGSGYTLVGYIGPSDCTPYAARNGTPVCWPIVGPSGIDQTTNTPTITVRMQDLAPTATKTAAASASIYTAADGSACTAQTTAAGSALSIYFFYIDGNGNPVGYAQPYPITVDTQAPIITSSFSVQGGDDSVVLSLPTTTDSSEIVTWTALCDPPRGYETDADLYVVPDSAGTDARTTSAASDSSTPVSSDSSTGASVDASADAETDAGVDASQDAQVSGDAQGQIFFPDDVADGGADADEDGGTSGTSDAAAGDGAVQDASVEASAGAVDATVGEGGIPNNDASIPSVGGCSSTIFGSILQDDASVTGQKQIDLGDYVPKYLCGQALGTDTSITLTGLRNMINYDVGLSATDSAGNSSPLVAACAVPAQSLDFYGSYTNDHGLAGGGFCETEGVGAPAGTSALGVLFSAMAAAMVRRRRRRTGR